MNKTETKCDGKVEFDLLIDGKYQRRVSNGILVEGKRGGCEIAVACSTTVIFDALIALEGFVNDHDLEEKYEGYKLLRSIDTNDPDKAMKQIDEWWENMKK